VDILALFAKKNQTDTLNEIGKFLLQNRSHLSAVILACYFNKFSSNVDSFKKYLFIFIDKYGDDKYTPSLCERYIAYYALRHLISLKEDGIIFTADPYDRNEREADLRIIPKAKILKVSRNDFMGLDLSLVNMRNVKMKNLILGSTDLLKSNIEFSNIENTWLEISRMNNVTFERCKIINSNFSICLLNRSKFIGCEIINASVWNSALNRSLFWDCTEISKVNFMNCDLNHSYFINVKLKECYFHNANLSNVTFNHVTLDDFTRNSLKNARNMASVKFIDRIQFSSLSERSFPDPIDKEFGDLMSGE
jgi:uncharacterized protein YjbI with pentapeptide repeats